MARAHSTTLHQYISPTHMFTIGQRQFVRIPFHLRCIQPTFTHSGSHAVLLLALHLSRTLRLFFGRTLLPITLISRCNLTLLHRITCCSHSTPVLQAGHSLCKLGRDLSLMHPDFRRARPLTRFASLNPLHHLLILRNLRPHKIICLLPADATLLLIVEVVRRTFRAHRLKVLLIHLHHLSLNLALHPPHRHLYHIFTHIPLPIIRRNAIFAIRRNNILQRSRAILLAVRFGNDVNTTARGVSSLLLIGSQQPLTAYFFTQPVVAHHSLVRITFQNDTIIRSLHHAHAVQHPLKII